MYRRIDSDILFRISSENILFSDSDITIDLDNFFKLQHKQNIKMDIKIKQYSGYKSEDHQEFMENLDAYFCANNIDSDSRKIGIFRCYINGPAKTWFRYLGNDQKDTWEHVETAFNQKFASELSSTERQLKSAEFLRLSWQQGQRLDDFCDNVISKGKALGKDDVELIAQFISGLPQQLAFFVRARNPDTLDQALETARSGEMFGYHQSIPQVQAMTNYVQGSEQFSQQQGIQGVLHTMQHIQQQLFRMTHSPQIRYNEPTQQQHHYNAPPQPQYQHHYNTLPQ